MPQKIWKQHAAVENNQVYGCLHTLGIFFSLCTVKWNALRKNCVYWFSVRTAIFLWTLNNIAHQQQNLATCIQFVVIFLFSIQRIEYEPIFFRAKTTKNKRNFVCMNRSIYWMIHLHKYCVRLFCDWIPSNRRVESSFSDEIFAHINEERNESN